MKVRNTFVLSVIFVGMAFAQASGDELRSKIRAVRYSPLAASARVQGDVRISINSGVVTLVSGPPLLAQSAIESAKELGSIQDGADLEVTYHFKLVDTVSTVAKPLTVKRGNAFDRAILRLFGLKTERIVVEYQCQESIPPANDLRISGATIEIWIYGPARCLQTESGMLIARRQ
jgi:hypothetical protein